MLLSYSALGIVLFVVYRNFSFTLNIVLVCFNKRIVQPL